MHEIRVKPGSSHRKREARGSLHVRRNQRLGRALQTSDSTGHGRSRAGRDGARTTACCRELATAIPPVHSCVMSWQPTAAETVVEVRQSTAFTRESWNQRELPIQQIERL